MPRTTSGLKPSRIRSPATTASGRPASRTFFQGASRSKPAMRTAANANPASGTSRSSGPPFLPTRRISAAGSSARSARATASAGIRCPPVPPPEINSRIRPPSIAEQGLRRALRGDVEQYPDRRQAGRHRATTVRDQWERHARDGKSVGDRGHVDEGLKRDPGCDRRGEHQTEAIRRAERGPIAAQREEEERGEHCRRAGEPGLLADDREDEVRMRLGQPQELLHRVAEANAEKAAGAERVERLGRLKAGAELVSEWIGEDSQPREAIGLKDDHGHREAGKREDKD